MCSPFMTAAGGTSMTIKHTHTNGTTNSAHTTCGITNGSIVHREGVSVASRFTRLSGRGYMSGNHCDKNQYHKSSLLHLLVH